ncbi:MAG: hypothetical protein HYU53_02730 [Acidobacteria bacterium]|nr:hypothetical protein [Acidobacteriota bacterium]
MTSRTGVACTVAAIVAVQCGGGRSAPTAPAAVGPANATPVVRSVTVSRTNIDAGQEVTLGAIVDAAAKSYEQLRYEWTVSPRAGVLVPDGPQARWRSPGADPVPASYVVTVTVVKPSSQVDASGSAVSVEQRSVGSSPTIMVNDARREMMAHGETFFQDVANADIAPEVSTRNFSDACSGKQAALAEITAQRAAYAQVSVTYALQLYRRSTEWTHCTAPDGAARCALMVYSIEWMRTRRADLVQERATGTQYLRGVYEQNRWWLCESRFDAGQ